MNNYQDTFERVEHKYLLTKQQAEQFYLLIEDMIKPDIFPKYSLYNIYYDSDNYDMISKSIEKPMYKEKLRLRSYGPIQKDGYMYLEMKKKYQGIVYKRRIQIDCSDPKVDTSQIGQELVHMQKFYDASQKVFIAYDREAYSGIEESDVRITFDTNIRYRFDHLNLKDDDHDRHLLNDDQVLLEIKVMNRYPLWLTHALSTLHLTRTSFSKYGTIYSTLLKERGTLHV